MGATMVHSLSKLDLALLEHEHLYYQIFSFNSNRKAFGQKSNKFTAIRRNKNEHLDKLQTNKDAFRLLGTIFRKIGHFLDFLWFGVI